MPAQADLADHHIAAGNLGRFWPEDCLRP